MKKIFITVIFLGLSFGLAIQAQAASGNSSVSAKKQSNGYYTITIKDPQGLKSFALKSPGNLPYSGDLNECPRVFVVDNVSPAVVNDFSGEVDADIIDCQNNADELEIPEIGDKKSVVGKHEEPPAPAVKLATPAATAAPSEVKVAPAIAEAPAAKETEIMYPVKELGGCADKDTCKVYCEEPGNMRACVNFAEQHNLISKKEAEDGRKFSSIVNSRGGGPGGCKTRESCEAYCENSDNIEACLAFAENSDLVEAKDLDEMRKVSKLLKEGAEFPGGCKTKSQCEAYCAKPDNMEACLVFAEKAGFIPKEELEMARKVVPLMKAGKTPGGCRSKESCEAYCENPDNLDACVAFGEQMGAISPEELAIIKKTGGKGPGGCRGKKQCENFCQSPENQETCFNFGKDNGLIPPEDLKKMEEGMKFITEALNDESSDLGQCLGTALGSDNTARAKAGKPILDRSIEEKLKGCFEQFPPKGMGPGGQGGPGGGQGGPGSQGGPGGCKTQEECQAYCQDNPEVCQKFVPQGGQGRQGERDEFQSGSENRGGEQAGLGCGIVDGTVAQYVCGTNGNSRGASTGVGVETTYFNECHAKQQGAEILHSGVCVRDGKPDVPCSDIARPVCGTDGNSWTNECNAKEAGAGIKHEGACTNEDRGQTGGSNQRNQDQGGRGPSSEDIQKIQKQYQQQYKQQIPQQYRNSQPPEGMDFKNGAPSQEDMQKIQQQFQQQYQQQIPQQYRQQMEGQNQQYQNFQPPSGSYGPPPGGMQPPADMQQQINFQPPPGM